MSIDRHDDSAEFLEGFSAENDENHESDGLEASDHNEGKT
jgi:hypothetical protein